MKSGNDELVDAALYIWFHEQREKNLPVNGAFLKDKSMLLFAQLYPDSPKGFMVALAISGAKQVSADLISACVFQFQFASQIQDYTHDQVFNCDKTRFQFRLLPKKTLASVFERHADGRKKSKHRITLNACANLTGSIKLPQLFIGKATRPICFKETNLANILVIYHNQKMQG
uniref:Uncharacterized protein n=1 Tax=Amphimedon queenslandica TaxID=400682 RepID=A0A1X7U9Z6_AMPQE